jgi:transcriptional regulator PpsR
MAVGKSLRAVAELQSRLVVAQQTMERDYWKLRQVETRYRQLFEASDEPVLLLNASTLRVAEANPAAIPLFSQSSRKREGLTGRDILPTLSSQERTALIAMLRVVREQGKSPAMIVRLGREPKSWMVSASLIKGDAGAQFLLRLAAVAGTTKEDAVNPPFSFEDVIERFPDGFVIIDADGVIRRANQAFLDLIECGSKASVQGERLGRWLWTPGADLAALIANVRRHGTVRLYSTIIHGELGAETAVEVSAAGIGPGKAQVVGVLLSNVSRRVSSHTISNNLLSALGPITDQVGRTSLRTLVDETTSVVERHYVKAALDLARGNRTAAAEILGLSRQSLYAKLNRYDLEKEPLTSPLDKDD